MKGWFRCFACGWVGVPAEDFVLKCPVCGARI